MPCSATTTRIQMRTDSARSAYDAHLKVGMGIPTGGPDRSRRRFRAPLFSRNAREASHRHSAEHRFKLEDPVRAVVERLTDTIRALVPPRLLPAALLLHLPQPEARRCAVHSAAVVREIMPIEEARRVRVIDRRVVAVVPVRERWRFLASRPVRVWVLACAARARPAAHDERAAHGSSVGPSIHDLQGLHYAIGVFIGSGSGICDLIEVSDT